MTSLVATLPPHVATLLALFEPAPLGLLLVAAHNGLCWLCSLHYRLLHRDIPECSGQMLQKLVVDPREYSHLEVGECQAYSEAFCAVVGMAQRWAHNLQNFVGESFPHKREEIMNRSARLHGISRHGEIKDKNSRTSQKELLNHSGIDFLELKLFVVKEVVCRRRCYTLIFSHHLSHKAAVKCTSSLLVHGGEWEQTAKKHNIKNDTGQNSVIIVIVVIHQRVTYGDIREQVVGGSSQYITILHAQLGRNVGVCLDTARMGENQ